MCFKEILDTIKKLDIVVKRYWTRVKQTLTQDNYHYLKGMVFNVIGITLVAVIAGLLTLDDGVNRLFGVNFTFFEQLSDLVFKRVGEIHQALHKIEVYADKITQVEQLQAEKQQLLAVIAEKVSIIETLLVEKNGFKTLWGGFVDAGNSFLSHIGATLSSFSKLTHQCGSYLLENGGCLLSFLGNFLLTLFFVSCLVVIVYIVVFSTHFFCRSLKISPPGVIVVIHQFLDTTWNSWNGLFSHRPPSTASLGGAGDPHSFRLLVKTIENNTLNISGFHMKQLSYLNAMRHGVYLLGAGSLALGSAVYASQLSHLGVLLDGTRVLFLDVLQILNDRPDLGALSPELVQVKTQLQQSHIPELIQQIRDLNQNSKSLCDLNLPEIQRLIEEHKNCASQYTIPDPVFQELAAELNRLSQDHLNQLRQLSSAASQVPEFASPAEPAPVPGPAAGPTATFQDVGEQPASSLSEATQLGFPSAACDDSGTQD